MSYKKPIIPLLFHAGAEMPFRLEPRQYIDFTRNYDAALAKLRDHIRWRSSPEGVLQSLKDRLTDAERDRARADDQNRARIEDEIAELGDSIARQQRVVDDPESVARETEGRIASGLERERERGEPVRPDTRTKFINPPPAAAPSWFQDRSLETRLVGKFLQDSALRLMTVVGRGGVGKTAMVCRLLKSLEGGRLPDDGGPLGVDGIVYLSPMGSRQLTFAHLYADLCKLLPDKQADSLSAIYKNPQASARAKMQALLEAFPGGRTVVLLDNLEAVLDPETGKVPEEELDESLRALLALPQHGIKVVLTTRVPPRPLLLEQPGRQTLLELDKGLESPYAEDVLRAMDADGRLGLKEAPAALLDAARERTRGFPRALEALAAILAADRDTSLKDILEDTEQLLPENVVEVLVGEAFSRLGPLAQQVMQALAAYACPVGPAAVDYLLQPYTPSISSAPVLGRLVSMQFARREAGRYYLHHVDRAYALDRVAEGQESDRDEVPPPFSQFALLKRAADYFEKTRTPRESWKSIDDLAPQLAEFELRVAGHEYDAAASVLLEIDFDYLMRWGHVRLAARQHEHLQGHVSDHYLKASSLNNLGLCYHSLGDYPRAIEYHEQSLAISREIGDRQGEVVSLGNLGLCYYSLGDYPRAIEYHEGSLAIKREIGNRQGEGNSLGNLGNCYYSLGDYPRAIEYLEQSLAISREIGNRQGEGNSLGNLGNCYYSLGDYPRAIEYLEQSLAISREIGDRYSEAAELTSLADVHLDVGDARRARQGYEDAITIADATGNTQNQNESRYGLAVLHLYQGDLEGARQTIEVARGFDYPRTRAALFAASGIVAMRLGDAAAARAAFSGSLKEADGLLTKSDRNLSALNTKALALCGLALSEDNRRVSEAIKTYGLARAVRTAPGVVVCSVKLLDALAEADREGVLATARVAATGA